MIISFLFKVFYYLYYNKKNYYKAINTLNNSSFLMYSILFIRKEVYKFLNKLRLLLKL
ncbi:tetratricopeptide repeat protein [Fusobacterium polymorphum]